MTTMLGILLAVAGAAFGLGAWYTRRFDTRQDMHQADRIRRLIEQHDFDGAQRMLLAAREVRPR
jgi:hypothetical protein